jgi:hypothetical protein
MHNSVSKFETLNTLNSNVSRNSHKRTVQQFKSISWNMIKSTGTSLVVITILGAGFLSGLIIPVAIGGLATALTHANTRLFLKQNIYKILDSANFKHNKVHIYSKCLNSQGNLNDLLSLDKTYSLEKTSDWLSHSENGKVRYYFDTVYAKTEMALRCVLFGVLAVATGTIQLKILSPVGPFGDILYTIIQQKYEEYKRRIGVIGTFLRFVEHVLNVFLMEVKRVKKSLMTEGGPSQSNTNANRHAISRMLAMEMFQIRLDGLSGQISV